MGESPGRSRRASSTFFQTGKIIISDLNEIEKGLADTELLFRALKDLHGLEDPEPLNNPEIKKDYREFHCRNFHCHGIRIRGKVFRYKFAGR